MKILIFAHMWQEDEKEFYERYLCDRRYKGIQIGKTGQEETADVLSIKPCKIEMMLQGVFTYLLY
jgi:hypothetical protein